MESSILQDVNPQRDFVPPSTTYPNAPWILPRLWGVFLLLLVAVSFPLWLAIPTESDIPLIPLIGNGIAVHGFATTIPSIILVAALLGVIIAPNRLRRLWWLVSAALLASFLVDQHRMQPWAYQAAIYAIVFASMDPSQARRWLIPLAASVYVYSAAGKFDFQFAHTVGQDFLEVMARPLGGMPDNWTSSIRAGVAFVFPAVELLLGIGLLFRRTRRTAAVLVMLMHATLIAILGPWGLDHSTGVLVWNLLLITQACFLLLWQEGAQRESIEREPAEREPVRPPAARFTQRIVQAVVLIALAAPLLERRGYWDHWTSWSLYSPHTSRVEIELHRSVIDSLPATIQSFVKPDVDGDRWQALELGSWSLATRRVPIYPQGRYQLALAAKFASQHELTDEIRARWKGVSDRWAGTRKEQQMLGRGEIEQALKSFWLTR